MPTIFLSNSKIINQYSMPNEERQIALIDKPETGQRFALIFSAVHSVPLKEAEQMFEVEKFSFKRALSEKAIEGVTDLSKMGVFLDVISNGLSFSGQMQHVYMQTRNVKTGKKGSDGKDIYEKRLVYSTAPDGKIYLAEKAGSISRVGKPTIAYDCDTYMVEDIDGRKKITYKKAAHRPADAKIVGGFIYVTFPDGAVEPYDMDMDDVERWIQEMKFREEHLEQFNLPDEIWEAHRRVAKALEEARG